MILILRLQCDDAMVTSAIAELHALGLRERLVRSGERVLLAIDEPCDHDQLNDLHDHPAVEWIVPTVPPGHHAESPQRAVVPQHQSVTLGTGQATIGTEHVAVIAGPCSVEDENQLMRVAWAAREAGAVALRGGAFKPRTNPYSFQGLGERALELLAQAREHTGLAVVTEVMSPEQAQLVAQYADVLQVGTRNMHNFVLLSAVGQTDKPILLKRGWSATLEEWLHAAEYIVNAGNSQVVLCERGIRTFEEYVRNTLALAVVPALKQRSPFPVVVDPSQGTGAAEMVAAMSKAAIACGADGLLVEVHPEPANALTDGQQSLDIPMFQRMMHDLRAIAQAVGRTL